MHLFLLGQPGDTWVRLAFFEPCEGNESFLFSYCSLIVRNRKRLLISSVIVSVVLCFWSSQDVKRPAGGFRLRDTFQSHKKEVHSIFTSDAVKRPGILTELFTTACALGTPGHLRGALFEWPHVPLGRKGSLFGIPGLPRNRDVQVRILGFLQVDIPPCRARTCTPL